MRTDRSDLDSLSRTCDRRNGRWATWFSWQAGRGACGTAPPASKVLLPASQRRRSRGARRRTGPAAARWETRFEPEDRGRLPRAVPYRTATRPDEASQRCVLAEDSPLHDGPGRSRELRRTLGSRQRASTRQRPWDVSRPVRPVLHQDGLARTGQVTCVCRHGSRRAESRGMGVQALSLWARHVQYLGLRPDPNAPANHADRRASDPSRQEAPRPGPRMVADVGERRNA